jgi:putative hydrolase of HD superfamily
MNEIQKIIKFVQIIEKLKRELRHSWLSNGRQESVAEHTWSATLLAFLLAEEIKEDINTEKLLKRIFIHDLVEIYYKDVPSFKNDKSKYKEEQQALDKILSKIPNEKLQTEISNLWEEFEKRESIEAKLAQVCDKAEAIIQHDISPIETFPQRDFDINPSYKDEFLNLMSLSKSLKRYKICKP